MTCPIKGLNSKVSNFCRLLYCSNGSHLSEKFKMEYASPPSLSSKEVLQGDIPHILEGIFLHLDYESLKTCFEVSKDWRKVLKSESFQKKAEDVFAMEITMDQEKLVTACGDGDIEMIKGLLSTDMLNINLKMDHPDIDRNYPITPLYMATWKGKANAIQILLERGADPDFMVFYGCTALHLASRMGFIEVVLLLIDSGANPNLADRRLSFTVKVTVLAKYYCFTVMPVKVLTWQYFTCGICRYRNCEFC